MTFLERQTSPSPSSRSSKSSTTLTGRISALGAKLTRTLSGHNVEEKDVLGDIPVLNERSTSRGREFTSSGRGGLGNIRQTSLSRDRPDGPDDFSSSRGREPVPASAIEGKAFSTGRGGAGNIRSPSRDVPSPRGRAAHPGVIEEEKREREVLEGHLEKEREGIHSTGRGGLGNLRSRSRDPQDLSPQSRPSQDGSRSRSRNPLFRSTGRGGAGNMVYGDTVAEAEALDEAERRRVGGVGEGIHSTGRGGAANLTSVQSPGVEHVQYSHPPGEWESTGRGGAGNIRSSSRPR